MTLVWLTMACPLLLALLLALFAGALLLALYATQLAPYRPVLRRIAVPVPEDWPRLSILHLSDFHVSRLRLPNRAVHQFLDGRADVRRNNGPIIRGLAIHDRKFRFLNRRDNCHILMATHDPLLFASLTKEQVRILRRDVDGSLAVEVPDVEEALTKAESLGGTRVMGPDTVPGMELVLGHLKDPEGHLIGLVQSGTM